MNQAPRVTVSNRAEIARFDQPLPVHARRRLDVQSRFDEQFVTPLNAAHFALADGMSIDAQASWMVRRILRMKCRYEYHNNGFAKDICARYADYIIGTGPKLQMRTENKKFNREFERRWEVWAEEADLAGKLHGSCAAKGYNGEGFLILRSNPNFDNPVKLDVFDIEADQVCSPLFGMYPSEYPDQFFDGVVLDPWGRPQTYHILRQHPGAFGAFVIMGYEFDAWPAQYIVHDYNHIRPGQQRGVPIMLPCLPNLANLRRSKISVVLAHENAAKWGVSVETNAAPAPGFDQSGNPVDPDAGLRETWEMEQASMNLMPAGHQAKMLHPEQPGPQYEALINGELSEIGQPFGMPLFVVSLDARLANMASAYVAMQPFGMRIHTERKQYNRLLNAKMFRQFVAEARLVRGLFSQEIPDELPHAWTWPRINDHADPSKMSTAAQTRIQSGVSSRRREAAELSLDLDEMDQQSADDYDVDLKTYRLACFQRDMTLRGTAITEAGGLVPPGQTSTIPGQTPGDHSDVSEDEEIE